MADAKRPLILFSGGLDSTFLLFDRLKHHGNVDVLYADGGQHIVKIHAEKLAREKIITALEKHTPHRVINRYEVGKIGHAEADGVLKLPSIHRPQQTSWFLAALFTINPEIHTGVEIGNVLGDDNLGYVADLSKAWHHLMRATRLGCFHYEPPAMRFPIMEFDKSRCWNALPEDVRELVWTCETPKWGPNNEGANAAIPCGICVPCRTLVWEAEDRNQRVTPLLGYADTYHAYMLDMGTKEVKAAARKYFREKKKRADKREKIKKGELQITDPFEPLVTKKT